MFFSPHIGWNPLAALCRRLATSLGAGIDIRRVLEREAETGSPLQRRQLAAVRDEVARGEMLGEAFASRGDYFPPFFVEMMGIGDKTGKLHHVLPKLAEYYEHLVRLRRTFLIGIAWPSLQLGMALGVIGLLILALGWVGQATGEATDLLGFGLVGMPGLVKYLTAIGFFVACGLVTYRLATRSFLSQHLLQLLYRLPGLGPNLRLMSLARMAWALGMALDSGADARQSIRLALASSVNPFYQRHQAAVDQRIRQGQEMHVAFRETGAFPHEFLDALEVGEETGQVSETMLRLADGYRDRAQATMTGVTLFATILVWCFVGGLLILVIFRLFGAYMGILQDAMGPI